MYRCCCLYSVAMPSLIKVEAYGKEGIVAVTHVYVLEVQIAHECLFVGKKVGS